MATKRIYFVRHGQTDYNRLRRHQLLSTPLNALGVQQARETALKLQKLRVDLFVSSDATRTLETAQVIQDAINVQFTKDKLFREVSRPNSILNAHFLSMRSIIYTIRLYVLNITGKWPYKDGENMQAVQVRAKHALERLACAQGDCIIVVSHRLFISAILAEILGKDVTKAYSHLWTMRSLKTSKNGSVTEVLYNPKEKIPWKILRRDDIPFK